MVFTELKNIFLDPETTFMVSKALLKYQEVLFLKTGSDNIFTGSESGIYGSGIFRKFRKFQNRKWGIWSQAQLQCSKITFLDLKYPKSPFNPLPTKLVKQQCFSEAQLILCANFFKWQFQFRHVIFVIIIVIAIKKVRENSHFSSSLLQFAIF